MGYDDEWDVDHGERREPFEMTVFSPYWKVSARQNFGPNVLLVLTDGTGSWRRTCELSAGKGWVIAEGGFTVEREDGCAGARFHAKSWVGRLITWATSVPDLMAILAARGGPRLAGVWKDLRFVFEEVEVDFGEDIGVKRKLMPVRFVGENRTASHEITSLSREASGRVDLAYEKTDTNGRGRLPSSITAGFSNAVLADLTAAARSAGKHADFIEAAGEVLQRAGLRQHISRIAQDGPGSLWYALRQDPAARPGAEEIPF